MFTMNDKVKSTNDTWTFAKSFDGTTDSFGILVFAFMCHHNSFLIFNSMSKPTINNWKKLVHTNVLISLVISMAFDLIEFFTFTGLTQGIKII
jgi:sodium-coupled neutral amino acid transporter 11